MIFYEQILYKLERALLAVIWDEISINNLGTFSLLIQRNNAVVFLRVC